MRTARHALALVSVLLLAARSSGAAPTWTYAPAPPSTPPPPASAPPSASAAASGSPAASASGGPAASGGATVTIIATNATKYDTPQVSTAAGKPFTIVFDNEDATAPHNVVLENPDGSPVKMGGDTAFFVGPAKHDYQVPALTAGAYPFHCQVHPQAMTGTLTVQ